MKHRKIYRFWLTCLLMAISVVQGMAHIEPTPIHSSKTIKLIENKGQWNPEVLFKATIPGGDVFITAKGLVYALIDEKQLHELNHNGLQQKVNAHNYRMSFKACNAHNVIVRKGTAFSEHYNYYLGSDKAKWASDCKAYESVVLQNIYPGIDAEIIAKEDFLKLNFILHPGADPSLIKLLYEGQDGLSVRDKSLLVQTSIATVKEEAPVALQQHREVSCSYQLTGNEVGFNLASYNKQQLLIIDPNIVFGTFSGSVADNFGFTATFDYLGNGYAGGTVFSAGFPVTFGAYQMNFNAGSKDAGILKFNPDGTQLLYATYLGGNSDEQPHSIICNAKGELYILGTTSSSSFPTTSGAFDRSYNGGYDIFIACLSVDGKELKYSTYWGGTKNDGINGNSTNLYSPASPLSYNYGDPYRGSILLDKNENVCIASVTASTTVQGYTIANGFQSTFGGGNQDGCVFKLTPNLSSVLFSSYLGGIADDAAYSIVIDPFNNMFVCGGTESSNIGKLQGQLTYKGDVDAFVAKIGALGNSLQKLVYVGTASYDQAYFIDIDSKNNIFITGQTEGNFQVKGNVYSNKLSKQFIASLNNNLDSIRLSTVFGAPNNS
ncbi:MAG: SBBP repeat-containing protein, partial [Bacteroidota bacterium]